MNFRIILPLFSFFFFFQASLVAEIPSLSGPKDRFSTLNRSIADVVVPLVVDSFKAPLKSFRSKTGKLSFSGNARSNFLPTLCGNLDLSFVTASYLFSSSLAWPLGARSPPIV